MYPKGYSKSIYFECLYIFKVLPTMMPTTSANEVPIAVIAGFAKCLFTK